jgi:hypothetical protein
MSSNRLVSETILLGRRSVSRPPFPRLDSGYNQSAQNVEAELFIYVKDLKIPGKAEFLAAKILDRIADTLGH